MHTLASLFSRNYRAFFFSAFCMDPGFGLFVFLFSGNVAGTIPAMIAARRSAMQNLSGALCQAATAAIAGTCIVAYGYRTLLVANAAAAVLASLLFAWLGLQVRKTAGENAACERSTEASRAVPQNADWMLERAAR
jgi:hypothetical protein